MPAPPSVHQGGRVRGAVTHRSPQQAPAPVAGTERQSTVNGALTPDELAVVRMYRRANVAVDAVGGTLTPDTVRSALSTKVARERRKKTGWRPQQTDVE